MTISALGAMVSDAQAQTQSPVARTAIRSHFAGICMDVPGQSTTQGTSVQAWTCNNTVAQKFVRTAAQELRVYDGTSNVRCLDNYAYQRNPGAPVVIWPCNGQQNQKWKFAKNGIIYSETSDQCLTINSALPYLQGSNGTRISLDKCTGATKQRWSRTFR